MTTLHERFLDHLAARGWALRRAAPGVATLSSPSGLEGHTAFLSLYTQLSSEDDTRWFLSAADYAGTTDSAFAWDAFRGISLEAAMSDTERQAVQTFWARHLPIFMSVDDEYEYLALDRESGRVVHGVEPEFEVVSEVASSLDALFEQTLAGRCAVRLAPES